MIAIQDYKKEIIQIQEAELLPQGFQFLEAIYDKGSEVKSRINSVSLAAQLLFLPPSGWSSKLTCIRTNTRAFWETILEMAVDLIPDDRIKELPLGCKQGIKYAIGINRLPKNFVKKTQEENQKREAERLSKLRKPQELQAFQPPLPPPAAPPSTPEPEPEPEPENQETPQPQFEVGDRVEDIRDVEVNRYNPGTITKLLESGKIGVTWDFDNSYACYNPKYFKLLEQSPPAEQPSPTEIAPIESVFLQDQQQHELIPGTIVRRRVQPNGIADEIGIVVQSDNVYKLQQQRRIVWGTSLFGQWVDIEALKYVDPKDLPFDLAGFPVMCRVHLKGLENVFATVAVKTTDGKIGVVFDNGSCKFYSPAELLVSPFQDFCDCINPQKGFQKINKFQTVLQDQQQHELIPGTIVKLIPSLTTDDRTGVVTAKMRGKRRVDWGERCQWVRIQDLVFVAPATAPQQNSEPHILPPVASLPTLESKPKKRVVNFKVGDRVTNDGNYNLGIKFIPGTITRILSTGKAKIVWDDRSCCYMKPENLILLSEADYPVPQALYHPTERITSIPGDITPTMVANLPWVEENAAAIKRKYDQTDRYKDFLLYAIAHGPSDGLTRIAIVSPDGKGWTLPTEDLCERGSKYNDLLWHIEIARAQVKNLIAFPKFKAGDRVIWGDIRFATLIKLVDVDKPGAWWEATIEPTNYTTYVCESDIQLEPFSQDAQYLLPGFGPQPPEPPDPDDFKTLDGFYRALDEFKTAHPEMDIAKPYPVVACNNSSPKDEDKSEPQDEDEDKNEPQDEDEDGGVIPGYVHPYYIEGEGPPYWPPPPGYPLQPEDREALEQEELEKYENEHGSIPAEEWWIMKAELLESDNFDRDIDPAIVEQVFNAITEANGKGDPIAAVHKVVNLSYADIRRAAYEVVNRNFYQYCRYSELLDNLEHQEAIAPKDLSMLRYLFCPLYVCKSLAELDILKKDPTAKLGKPGWVPSEPKPKPKPEPEPKQQSAKMLPLSFGWCANRLPQKEVTRRTWSDDYAKRFKKTLAEGRSVVAYDKAPFAKGKAIAELKLDAVYKERLTDMPASDVAREGFPELTKSEFLGRFFKGDDTQDVWVVRFKIVKWLVPKEDIARRSPASIPQALALAG